MRHNKRSWENDVSSQCSLLVNAVQCSTVQYSAVQYSAVQYSAVRYSIVVSPSQFYNKCQSFYNGHGARLRCTCLTALLWWPSPSPWPSQPGRGWCLFAMMLWFPSSWSCFNISQLCGHLPRHLHHCYCWEAGPVMTRRLFSVAMANLTQQIKLNLNGRQPCPMDICTPLTVPFLVCKCQDWRLYLYVSS